MDGQSAPALSAIEQARLLLAAADAERSTFAYFYGTGQLTSAESICCFYLNDLDRGAAVAETALASIDPTAFRR